MRLRITLKPSNSGLRLPIQYNHVIQAALYASLDPRMSAFLHDTGFTLESRSFKMFTFSRPLGRFSMDKQSRELRMCGPVTLVVSSPFDQFCSSLLTILMQRGTMNLAGTVVEVEAVKVECQVVERDEVDIRTLSPVTCYSTMMRADGSKYTCYFQPGEAEFERQIGDNLRKKYEVYTGQPFKNGNVKVVPLQQPKLSVVLYEGTVIKGYSGRMRLIGPRDLLQIGVDAGLGAKNSQGFGCVELQTVVKTGYKASRELLG